MNIQKKIIVDCEYSLLEKRIFSEFLCEFTFFGLNIQKKYVRLYVRKFRT